MRFRFIPALCMLIVIYVQGISKIFIQPLKHKTQKQAFSQKKEGH